MEIMGPVCSQLCTAMDKAISTATSGSSQISEKRGRRVWARMTGWGGSTVSCSPLRGVPEL